jgi:hypothetical protein
MPLESKTRLSRHKKHAIKSKVNRQSVLIRTARIVAGSCACAAGAFCLKTAHIHLDAAKYHANGYGYFLTPANWWPLVKTCWIVSNFGETAALVTPLLPVVGDGQEMFTNMYDSPRKIALARSSLNGVAWLSLGVSLSWYGLKSLYKAVKTDNKKQRR